MPISQIIQMNADLERLDLLIHPIILREEWRFVQRECGSVFVTTTGEELKHMSSVNNC